MTFDYRDVLLKAASLVEQGWCQKVAAVDASGFSVSELDDEAKRFCALGALSRAATDIDADSSYHRASAALCSEARTWSIATWNDTPGRTAHEVAEAMRKAAE